MLDALVTAGTLSGCSQIERSADVLNIDIPSFPWAFLALGKLDNRAETNRDNTYSFTFDILVLHKNENITDGITIEVLMTAMVRYFDNNPTLSGFANAGFEPAISSPEPVTHKNGQCTAFFITLKANSTESLTF